MIFAPLTNLLPVTASVNDPTPIVLGVTEAMTGIGLSKVTALAPWIDGLSWLAA